MRPSNALIRRWMTCALLLSMSLPGSLASAQDSVSVPSAVIRQCAIDAKKADQYDELREQCERVREEVYGLRAMHKVVLAERDELRLRVHELEGRWSPVTWYLLGAVTGVAIVLSSLVAR